MRDREQGVSHENGKEFLEGRALADAANPFPPVPFEGDKGIEVGSHGDCRHMGAVGTEPHPTVERACPRSFIHVQAPIVGEQANRMRTCVNGRHKRYRDYRFAKEAAPMHNGVAERPPRTIKRALERLDFLELEMRLSLIHI